MPSETSYEAATSSADKTAARSDGESYTTIEKRYIWEAALFFLPTALFWLLLLATEAASFLLVGCEPLNGPGTLEVAGSTCRMKTILEWPIWTVHGGFLLLTAYILVSYHKDLEMLKRSALFLSFTITTIIRCLSSFSGRVSSSHFSLIFFHSNSPGKVCWLVLLFSLDIWNWTYLSTYQDVVFIEASHTIVDEHGATLWQFPKRETDTERGTDTERETNTEREPDFFPPFYPWEDILVRLSYIHVIDNLVHVLWMRYFITNAPYTLYVNNSEILTGLLAIAPMVYTYARIRTHILFDRDDEETLINTAQEGMSLRTRRSVLEGLLRYSPVAPRDRSKKIYEILIGTGVCAFGGLVLTLCTDARGLQMVAYVTMGTVGMRKVWRMGCGMMCGTTMIETSNDHVG